MARPKKVVIEKTVDIDKIEETPLIGDNITEDSVIPFCDDFLIEPPVMMQEDVEYKGYTIVAEPHGRVIVTDRGLHIVEFVNVEAKLFTLIDQAKEFIDNGSV